MAAADAVEPMTAALAAVVGGSGIDLLPLLDACEEQTSFVEAGLSPSTVAGHPCCFYSGKCGSVPLIVQAGRIHLYEGRFQDEVEKPVDWLHAQGVRTLILTNAVGGISPSLRRGDLVGADRMMTWPCVRTRLPETLSCSVLVSGCDAQGTYCWMHGPCYETAAEIGALRRMGVMTVGMSCAVELARARELGMACAVVSCVTNVCGAPGGVTHLEVLEQARAASARLCDLLRGFLRAG